MKYVFWFLIGIVFSNCTFYRVQPKETRDKIPKGSNQVVLQFDIPKDSLYIVASNLLFDENFRIYNADKQVAYINTDSKFVDNNMSIRLNIKISGDDNGSELNGKAEWLHSTTSDEVDKWYQAKMELGGYFEYAFETMIASLLKLPYKEIRFVKQ